MRRAVHGRVALIVLLLLALAIVSAHAQRRFVPLSSGVEELLAQQAVTPDGKEVTFRGAAADDVRVCIEPRRGHFGPTRCFTLGAIRRGDVREVAR